MSIQINTAKVLSTADQIDTINKKIENELTNVDSVIRTLQKSWSGSASKSCASRFDQIKSMSNVRFSVVDSMVSFMKIQVTQGYESTEQAATNAASAFK